MELTNDRRNKILQEIIKSGSATVHDLSNEFSVSYETIRKDLKYLDNKGYVVKEHGGATALQNSVEYSFNIRQEKQTNLKREVAYTALSLIPDNVSIILGSGSTVVELTKLLVTKKGLKIYTDSFPAANYLLNSKNEVYFFGGKVRPKSSSVYGGWTYQMINSVRADLCFIGSDNFEKFNGPTTPSYADYEIDRLLLERSNKKYVLSDKTKFKGDSVYQIANWENITGLITNKLDNALSKKYSKKVTLIQSK